MIDFALTDEQLMLRRMAHDFAEKEIVPVAEELDREAKFPHEIIAKAREVGLININIPEEYGGLGASVLEECLIAEEISWACSGVGTALMINNLAAVPIKLVGTEEQKKEWLSRMVEGELASYAVTEPNAGSDVAAMEAFAEKRGNEYVLNGSKTFISNASEASFFVVFARTDREDRYKGISCFIVERDREGFSVSKKFDKLGQRCADTAEISLEDVVIPEENRLGPEGSGFLTAMRVFDISRPTVSAAAVGVARRAMEEALRYSQERVAFSQPIVRFQAVGHMLADMAINIEAARLLAWKAAWNVDRGQPDTRAAAFAKAFAADMAMKACVDAVQIFGGYGYMKEYPVEKLMRDVKVFQIYEGTSQIQRNIIVRELTRG
ncbi:MAG TPA: acyl-CoA dehydrogenase [Chloroflexi bacterium]|nr:acyl-CoA dehydrogenase [Chloroflexota bacterium]